MQARDAGVYHVVISEWSKRRMVPAIDSPVPRFVLMLLISGLLCCSLDDFPHKL